MRVVLHIGSHKTGSSHLQDHLFYNQGGLLAGGVHYPQLDGTPFLNQHSSLAIALRDEDKRPALDVVAALCEATRALGADTLLLSGEAFFFASLADLSALKDAFDSAGAADVHVVAYIRNTSDYVRSQLNQHLRSGQYLVTETEFRSKLANYRPGEIIQRWESVFGDDRVGVFSYDEHKPRLLDHFVAAARIPRLRECRVSGDGQNRSIDFLCAVAMNQLLFDRDPSVSAAVYSELVRQHAAPADRLYPREAEIVRGVVAGMNGGFAHPKLARFRDALERVDIPHEGHDLVSILRLATTIGIIGAVVGSRESTGDGYAIMPGWKT